MSGFDPDAYLSNAASPQASAFDPDEYLAKPGDYHTLTSEPQNQSMLGKLGTQLAHAGEDVIGGVYHQAGNLADIASGKSPQDPNSYATKWASQWAHPSDEAEPDVKEQIRRAAPKVDLPSGPFWDTVKERGGQLLEGASTVTGLLSPLRGSAFDINLTKPAAMAGSPQSISAAAASPQFGNASPELRQAFNEATEAQRAGNGSVDMEAVNRHLEAESLPVPVKLTKGQASQDPRLISQEMNNRGKLPGVAERYNEQNKALIDNLQTVRDDVGERVFTSTPAEHGDTLIKAYKDKAAAADADINAKYQALRDANGGQFPVDAQALQSNVSSALHSKLLYEHAPAAEMHQLERAAEGGMTFEQYEAMRTNLARVMRSSSDGNEVAAAGVIRSEMEKLPLSGDAAALKPLADSARSAAKAQFDALKADPAYAAAVNDKVTPDRFVQRFIVGGGRDQVAKMAENIPEAKDTMGVAALDYLRDSARVSGGNFSQYGYNKGLRLLQDKVPHLFDPATAEKLDSLGNVANYTQFQPRGSFVNNSNTTVAARAGEMGKTMAEQAINAKTFGFGGTLGRKYLEGRAAKKAAEDILKPGAGILKPATTP